MRLSPAKFGVPLLILSAAILACACANKETLDQLAAAGASGASSVSPTDGANSTSGIAAAVAGGAELQASGIGTGTCPTYASQGPTACAGTGEQVMTFTYLACTLGATTADWTGGELLTFSGSAVCGTTTLPIENSGDALTRTFTGSAANHPTTRTSTTGFTVVLDTNLAAGYALGVSGGALIEGTSPATTGPQSHTIEVMGLHASSPLWDYSISNSSVLTVQNPGAAPVITSGALFIQHNLDLYSATAVFTNVAFSAPSCFPQSGKIVTTFSGSRAGQESLTFTGGGAATFVNSAGVTANVQLNHCF